MKTYYNEHMMQNTPEGQAVWKELHDAICPIIKREFNEGFNPSEILDMVIGVSTLEIASLRLRYSCTKMKEKRQATKNHL